MLVFISCGGHLELDRLLKLCCRCTSSHYLLKVSLISVQWFIGYFDKRQTQAKHNCPLFCSWQKSTFLQEWLVLLEIANGKFLMPPKTVYLLKMEISLVQLFWVRARSCQKGKLLELFIQTSLTSLLCSGFSFRFGQPPCFPRGSSAFHGPNDLNVAFEQRVGSVPDPFLQALKKEHFVQKLQWGEEYPHTCKRALHLKTNFSFWSF